MGVRPEHIGADVAPHHELDHALGYTFLDEMRDPAVPEDMGRDVFPDAGGFRDALEPLVDGCHAPVPCIVLLPHRAFR